MRPGKRCGLPDAVRGRMLDDAEQLETGQSAKVEDPFRLVKRQLAYDKLRYRRLKMNTVQRKSLIALSNRCMARCRLLHGSTRPFVGAVLWILRTGSSCIVLLDRHFERDGLFATNTPACDEYFYREMRNEDID